MVHITDTGYVSDKNIELIHNAYSYLIECNYENSILMKSDKYPFVIKQKIMSDDGHLSNDQCYDCLEKVVGNLTKIVMYAHVSENNNLHSLIEKRFNTVNVEKQLVLDKSEIVEVTFE